MRDTIKPVAICQDIEVFLDVSGTATLSTNQIDNGSSDNCQIEMDLDQIQFGCLDLSGSHQVILTVSDQSGNQDICHATVTVTDPIKPVATCRDIEVFLDQSGKVAINVNQIDNGSYDNCLVQLQLDKFNFNCLALSGAQQVVLTATDPTGNREQDTCHASITVLDKMAPTALCQDITVTLDESGAESISPGMVNNGSLDNCQLNLELDRFDFTCEDVEVVEVILTVIDPAENRDTCHSMITVEANSIGGACVLTCEDSLIQPTNTWTGAVSNDWHEAQFE